jgi:hypothetical protein
MNLRKYPEVLALAAIIAFAAVSEGPGYGHRPILLDETGGLPAPRPKPSKLRAKLSMLPRTFENRTDLACNRVEMLTSRVDTFASRVGMLASRFEQTIDQLVTRIENRKCQRFRVYGL